MLPRTTPPDTESTLRIEVRTSPDSRRAGANYLRAMHLAERDRDPSPTTAERSTEEGPALRDAAAVAARAAADEADAASARERFRDGPMPSIEPDERIVGHL